LFHHFGDTFKNHFLAGEQAKAAKIAKDFVGIRQQYYYTFYIGQDYNSSSSRR
jgi:hypothetical protein